MVLEQNVGARPAEAGRVAAAATGTGSTSDVASALSRYEDRWNRCRRNSFTLGYRTGWLAGMRDGVLKWTHGPSFEDGGIRFRLWAPEGKEADRACA